MTGRSRSALCRLGGDRGSAALFVAIFAPAMIFMAGLVIDGGGTLEARQRAADMAEQAARAAGNECDVALLRSLSRCQITASRLALEQIAAPYVYGEGTSFTLTPRDPAPGGGYFRIDVTVTVTFQTTLMGIVPAFETITIDQTASAVVVTGL